MPTLPSCSDYSTSIEVSGLIKASKLAGGAPEKYNGRPVKYSGGFCIVFPYNVSGRKYAVRCWHAYLEGAKERTKIIAESLKKTNLPYFVGFEYVDEGIVTPSGVHPIVVMDWVDAKPLKEYIKDNLYDSSALSILADNFAKMAKELHQNNLSHGDLQHGNIMVKTDGTIVLVDYDSMYVPELDGWTDEISGLAGYQHPARWENKFLTPKADYFSELVIYTSLKALIDCPDLWDDLDIENTDTLLFSAEDIKSGGSSLIFDIIESLGSCNSLVAKIKEALSCNTIDAIMPLEDNIKSVAEVLSGLWSDNGYRPAPAYEKKDVVKVTSKW